MEMCWLASLIVFSSLSCDYFASAAEKTVTTQYDDNVPGAVKFKNSVPIEVNEKTVYFRGLGGLKSANSVIVDNANQQKYTVRAKYSKLTLYGDCSGQMSKALGIGNDCSVVIKNLGYKVTFEKKQQKYEVVPGSGKVQDLGSVKVSGFTNKLTRGVDGEDLAVAVRVRLIEVDKPSQLLLEMEKIFNDSFRHFALSHH